MSPPREDRTNRPASGPFRCLASALDRRAALLTDPQTNVGRLFNGLSDGIDGLVIERLGDVLIAQTHAGRLRLADETARDVCAEVAQRLGSTAVYRKIFPKDRSQRRADLEQLHTDPQPWVGSPVEPEIKVRESGLTFLVRPYDGFATGLYLDHRAQRQHVRETAAGRCVLNAFAYTCGFTVAAGLGGAASTVSVDVSRKCLEWGKRNLAGNALTLQNHRFICSDVLSYYRRATRQGQRFDLVILDPPTFARPPKGGGAFVLAEDLDRLLRGAISLLNKNGYIHLSVNHRKTTEARLRAAIETAAHAAGRRCARVDSLPLPDDFGNDPEFAKCVVAGIRH